MENIEVKYQDAARALSTLKEILNEPFSVIVRDASIQRFEYTFEAMWKYVKEYLRVKEGIVSNSPKSSFRELFSIGLATEEEVEEMLIMTDKRNETAYTYKQEVAQIIYDSLKSYMTLMESILNKLTT